MNLIEQFTDPILRGPMIGSILMGISCASIGVCAFIRKQLLASEALAHAAWPGVVLSALLLGFFVPDAEQFVWVILLGGGIFSWIGLMALRSLSTRFGIKSDTALCIVLSSFFGLGTLFMSAMQLTLPTWHKQVQGYLFGQLASMTDAGIIIYAVLSFLAVVIISLLFKEIQLTSFDAPFAKVCGVKKRFCDRLIFFLMVLAVVIGMKTVGVVLMSGLLIAPVLGARAFTNRLGPLFIISALIAAFCCTLGNVAALAISNNFKIAVPAGPVIILSLTAVCLLSMLAAPKRGILAKIWRKRRFYAICSQENILKSLWHVNGESISILELKNDHLMPQRLDSSIRKLKKAGLLCTKGFSHSELILTPQGQKRAQHLVRLHRLWEVYLASYLDVSHARAHFNAEQIEHILTPELEVELERLVAQRSCELHKTDIRENISSDRETRKDAGTLPC